MVFGILLPTDFLYQRFLNQIQYFLTGGQTYDAKVAVEPLKKVDISGSHILADKAYGAASIREYISEHGVEYTIPPRRNIKEPWEYDRERYKRRHVIDVSSMGKDFLKKVLPQTPSQKLSSK